MGVLKYEASEEATATKSDKTPTSREVPETSPGSDRRRLREVLIKGQRPGIRPDLSILSGEATSSKLAATSTYAQ